MLSRALAPLLTPRGHLTLVDRDDAPAVDGDVAERLTAAFVEGSGAGLLQLGAGEIRTPLPPSLGYWREFAARFVSAVCAVPEADTVHTLPPVPPPPGDEIDGVVAVAPPMAGAEYLDRRVLLDLWSEMGRAFGTRLATDGHTIQQALRQYDPAWHTVGRVCFHLAENRRDEERPFAFLATYTRGLSAHGTPQHVPLGQALREYAGAANRSRLLSLLLPVQRAAGRCPWLKALVDEGEIFHPLRWSPDQAVALLRDVHPLEDSGVVVRVPANWKAGRPPRATVSATVGTRAPAGVGLEALVDFRVELTVEGEPLTPAEAQAILAGVDGLTLLRGRWVEVDRERIGRMIDEFKRVERAASDGGLSFAEAMRLVAGAGLQRPAVGADEAIEWSAVAAGPWLSGVLARLRGAEGSDQADPGAALRGTLRPYQRTGVRWLHALASLQLGACLADDMGLGKTIQVLALLLVMKRARVRAEPRRPRASLLVAPASLIANWTAEADRFAPDLKVIVAHPSFLPARSAKGKGDWGQRRPDLAETDLVVTSYGAVRRLTWVKDVEWNLVVADEAQAIKNPVAAQTRAVKALRARARIAMTGTPVENRLGDLWSIFDFVNPGLLGSARQFTTFTKRLADRPHNAFGPLRELVRPYMLRRLKTDPAVITDLPEKTEVNAYCLLSRTQAALYAQAVDDLKTRLTDSTGIERRGLVLASLLRLKQICNHPSQWVGDGTWRASDSGKYSRLSEVAETVSARQEKMLVFTQFREMTEPLAAHLAAAFGRPGLVLHGGTPVKARRDLVARFQEDEQVPFFVLSLKAGGSGLNLTAASHVVHFDRWWNPAVEDQATDRAFRIGQTRNVLVHKFVCRGTVEERIDEMIVSKRGLARDVLEGGAELLLTEMKDEDLLKLVSLDVRSALAE
jgi:superfamily II DNA or RNA helicase